MADGQKKPQRKTKGRMARELVYYCIYALTLTLAWAVIIKTVASSQTIPPTCQTS